MLVFAFVLKALSEGKYNSGLVNAGINLGILKDPMHPEALGVELVPVKTFREGVVKNAIDGEARAAEEIDADVTKMKELFDKETADTEFKVKAAFQTFEKTRYAVIATDLFSPVVDSIRRAYVYKHDGKTWNVLGHLIFTGPQRLPYNNFKLKLVSENEVDMEISLSDGFFETVSFKRNDQGNFIEDKRSMVEKNEVNMNWLADLISNSMKPENIEKMKEKMVDPGKSILEASGHLIEDFKKILETSKTGEQETVS